MPSVFIVNPNPEYDAMFDDMAWTLSVDPETADLIQFTGGADVSPALYGQEKHRSTYSDSYRDQTESVLFAAALQNEQPMAGICRGGQFLNVKSGGSMFQHVDKHGLSHTHEVTDVPTGDVIECSSTHHQMMRPSDRAWVVGVAHRSTFRHYMDAHGVRIDHGGWTAEEEDYEVLFYSDTRCLCFQPHPEFNGLTACRNYYFDLLARHLNL